METIELVNKLKKDWSSGIITQNVDLLLSLYDPKATLKPTLSPIIRTIPNDIKAYFIGSKQFNDSGFINNGINKIDFTQSFINEVENCIIDVGKYTFFKTDNQKIEADYTFVYLKVEDGLKIISHHSSLAVE
jgi:hypothetical protein